MKAKSEALPWLDCAIPAGVFNGIGIGSAKHGVITASDAVVAGVLPSEVPTAYSSGALIGDFDGGGKACAPLPGYLILAGSLGLE